MCESVNGCVRTWRDMQNIMRQLNVSLLYIMDENDTMLKSNEMILYTPDYTMALFRREGGPMCVRARVRILARSFLKLIRSMSR